MEDIFNHKILCNRCENTMESVLISRNGFNLRAKKCLNCGSSIIHSEDKKEYEEFMRLKEKEFNVKMRMVGNSYAVSIPREIVDFMQEQERMIDNMVKLTFQDSGRVSLDFNVPEEEKNQRVIKSREIKIVRNNKPVLHSREFSDSAHPEKNKKEVKRFEGQKLKNGK
jgi:hypothetical protein